MADQDSNSLRAALTQSSHDDVTQSLVETGFFQRLGEDVPKAIGANAKLLNFRYSTIVEFRESVALYIPVAVSASPDGRRTVYELHVGEKTLMGIYIQNNRVYEEFFTRVDKDIYDVAITTLNGDGVVFTGQGKLERIDERVGLGKIHVTGTGSSSASKETKTQVWVLWSCIKINHETKE
jgi:hypothetical protein